MGWSDDYLEHHGILGQKWGVRRFETAGGKLTPAGKNQYNSVDGKYQKVKKVATALTDPMRNVKGGPVKDNVERGNALRRKYGKKTTFENNQEYIKPVEDASRKANNSDEKTTDKKGLTDKQKKMIIAGAAVAGTALAAYGGYKLYQLNKEATEGLSNDFHAKAANKLGEAHSLTKQATNRLNVADDFKIKAGTHANLGNSDEAKAYKDLSSTLIDRASSNLKEAKSLREEGGQLLKRAKAKNFTISEKANYLKNQKDNKLGSQKQLEKVKQQYTKDRAKWERGSQSTPPPLPTSHSKAGIEATNKLASEASSLARSVTMTGPIKTSSKPAQNPAKEIVRKQVVRELQRNPDGSARVTSSAANKPLSSAFSGQQRNVKSFNEVFSSTKGSKTFIDASKANDDLVQELLKKNTLRF